MAIKTISPESRSVDVPGRLFGAAPIELARAGHECGIDKELSWHIVVMHHERSFNPSEWNPLLPDALEKRIFVAPKISGVEAAQLREQRSRDHAIRSQRKPALTPGDRLRPKIDLPDDGPETSPITVDSRRPCNGRIGVLAEVSGNVGAAIRQEFGVALDEEEHIALRRALARDVEMDLACGVVRVGVDRDDRVAALQQAQEVRVLVERAADNRDDLVLRSLQRLGKRGLERLPFRAPPIEHGNDDRDQHGKNRPREQSSGARRSAVSRQPPERPSSRKF